MLKERMSECARVFLGTHDFTSFTSSKLDPRKSKVKTITRLDIVQEEHAVRLVFGNGFLRYMVRMIAQTLIKQASIVGCCGLVNRCCMDGISIWRGIRAQAGRTLSGPRNLCGYRKKQRE